MIWTVNIKMHDGTEHEAVAIGQSDFMRAELALGSNALDEYGTGLAFMYRATYAAAKRTQLTTLGFDEWVDGVSEIEMTDPGESPAPPES